jgi:hypothetical protein
MPPAISSLRTNTRARTKALFGSEHASSSVDVDEETSHRERIAAKIRSEYENVKELPFFLAEKQPGKRRPAQQQPPPSHTTIQTKLIEDVDRSQRSKDPTVS